MISPIDIMEDVIKFKGFKRATFKKTKDNIEKFYKTFVQVSNKTINHQSGIDLDLLRLTMIFYMSKFVPHFWRSEFLNHMMNETINR